MAQQCEHEEVLRQIKALYPQCSECHYHFKSQKLLDKHMCDGAQQCLDALSIAMRHADKRLAQMNLTVHGAIDRASFIGTGDEMPFTTFESNFYSAWAYARKNMHPKLTTKVKTIINECWKAEMEIQKVIKLSELPLPGKTLAVYQTIGRIPKCQILLLVNISVEGLNLKDQLVPRRSFEELDLAKGLLSWKKLELMAYLSHYNITKSGNKKTVWNLAVTYTQKVPSQQKQENLRNQYDSVISLAKLGHSCHDAADDCYHLILQAWYLDDGMLAGPKHAVLLIIEDLGPSLGFIATLNLKMLLLLTHRWF
ncbi:hypothetical protein EMCRGX_G020524 [Ephydatia muelleri]